jgi:hypothetical protein
MDRRRIINNKNVRKGGYGSFSAQNEAQLASGLTVQHVDSNTAWLVTGTKFRADRTKESLQTERGIGDMR